MEAQVKEIEARGKVLLEEYKAQRGDKPITRTEQLEILEPLAGAFTLMSNAINMSGTRLSGVVTSYKGKKLFTYFFFLLYFQAERLKPSQRLIDSSQTIVMAKCRNTPRRKLPN